MVDKKRNEHRLTKLPGLKSLGLGYEATRSKSEQKAAKKPPENYSRIMEDRGNIRSKPS